MAVITIYKCDKCGKEQTNPQQFWTVGVTANPQVYSSDQFVPKRSMHVCRDCLDGMGVYVEHYRAPEEKPPEPPTTEDLIRELVQRCTQ